MNADSNSLWLDANQRYLVAELARIRARLEAAAEGKSAAAIAPVPWDDDRRPPALEQIVRAFGLSAFERDILLLAAGAELDARIAGLCAKLQACAQPSAPTFSLALGTLENAHWSALEPAAPLRGARLVRIGGADLLTTGPLRVEERVLHFLAGVHGIDARLAERMQPHRSGTPLAPSHAALAVRLAEALAAAPAPRTAHLYGRNAASLQAVAAHTALELGLTLYAARARHLPQEPAERADFASLWRRDAALSQGALMIDAAGTQDEHGVQALEATCAGLSGLVFVTAREPLPFESSAVWRIEVAVPDRAERAALARTALGEAIADDDLHRLLEQFPLDAADLEASRLAVQEEPTAAARAVWRACRDARRRSLDGLAQRLEPKATWDDLVLPETPLTLLRDIARHVRWRFRVYGEWGFAARDSRGLGISALFSGPSGTGKTMAAEVLARDLDLDCFRIDLSAVVSKYIGETEKNLERLFDAAEESGAILLFDEADALFGKRSEVKDSHDRYANVEVAYLLQRMESYRGLAILTTNIRHNLDEAFLRRIRFVVSFPFPGFAERAEIWRRMLPAATPTEDLDFKGLAKLSVAGGSIRNIAINAAFLAADRGQAVGMAHMMEAARVEYAKLERSLSSAETGGLG
jgi:hypothetical protein